jgi:hypothetical protein
MRKRREIGRVSGQSHSVARLDIGFEDLAEASTPYLSTLPQSLGTPANGGAIRRAYIDRIGVIWILDIVEPSYDKWAPFLVELLCPLFS